ncbi:MAG: hypothetical protein QM625_24075 [Ralstonia sp.]|nr:MULTISPECIES: hypothetical protein [Burkholderiaceae]
MKIDKLFNNKMKTTIDAPIQPKRKCRVEKVSDHEAVIHFRTGCWHTIFDWLLIGIILVATFVACVIAGGALSSVIGSIFLHQNWLLSEWWRDVILIFGLYIMFAIWFIKQTWPGKAAITVIPEGVKWEAHQVTFDDVLELSVTSVTEKSADRYSRLVLSLTNKARASLSHGWTKGSILRDVRDTILEIGLMFQPQGAGRHVVMRSIGSSTLPPSRKLEDYIAGLENR